MRFILIILLAIISGCIPDHGSQNSPRADYLYGVVVGIVRDIRDPEGLGRVKVDFPWLAEDSEAVTLSSDEDRAHSYWARIATLMAGVEFGSCSQVRNSAAMTRLASASGDAPSVRANAV